MNWQVVIHALNEEAVAIAKRLNNSQEYGTQRHVDLTVMQMCVMLAKCLQTGIGE